jgi:phosphate transport system substrate-binding protein
MGIMMDGTRRHAGGVGPAPRDRRVDRVGPRSLAGAVLGAALLLDVTACSPGPHATSSDDAGSDTSPLISCAPGTITGSGSTAQQLAMDSWISTYMAACASTKSTISYQATGSAAGLKDFADGTTAFGGSDTPPQGTQKAAIDARCGGEAVSLPMVVGPIAVVYTLAGVTNLQLSPATLAGIFSGSITQWNDPAIRAENVDASLPAVPIVTVHRSDGSGTTDNFTRFLAATAAGGWRYPTGLTWTAPGGLGADHNEGVAAAVRRTPGAIGYAELAYAQNAGLPTAKIRNAAGQYVDPSPTAASLSLSTTTDANPSNDTATRTPDLTVTVDYTTPTPGAYPVSLVSYEIVCARGGPPQQAALLKSFLVYTASPTGQHEVDNRGYAPLPEGLAKRVRAAVAALP